MRTGWIIAALLVAIGFGILVWAAARWLARSWEVLDDDQLTEKLAPRESSTLWLRLGGWLTSGPRRLTYRRDKRGRFRRIRR